MTMLKLVESDGTILGAVVIPDEKVAILFRSRNLVLRWVDAPEIKWWNKDAPPNTTNVHTIVIADHPGRPDAVMIVQGDLWNFEKVPGCFFVPGYDLLMKGRR